MPDNVDYLLSKFFYDLGKSKMDSLNIYNTPKDPNAIVGIIAEPILDARRQIDQLRIQLDIVNGSMKMLFDFEQTQNKEIELTREALRKILSTVQQNVPSVGIR